MSDGEDFLELHMKQQTAHLIEARDALERFMQMNKGAIDSFGAVFNQYHVYMQNNQIKVKEVAKFDTALLIGALTLLFCCVGGALGYVIGKGHGEQTTCEANVDTGSGNAKPSVNSPKQITTTK